MPNEPFAKGHWPMGRGELHDQCEPPPNGPMSLQGLPASIRNGSYATISSSRTKHGVIADRAPLTPFFLCSGPPPSYQSEIYHGQGC